MTWVHYNISMSTVMPRDAWNILKPLTLAWPQFFLRLARLRSLDHPTHAKEAASTFRRTSRSFRERHWALGKAQMCGQISARESARCYKYHHTAVYTTVKHCKTCEMWDRHLVIQLAAQTVVQHVVAQHAQRLGRQPSSRRVLSFKFRWMVRLWMCLTPLIPNTLEEPLWTKRQWQRE